MAKPPIRKFQTARALESAAALNEVLLELTKAEVEHCLKLEAASRKRRTFVTTLARRLARLHRQEFLQQLAETYDAPYIIEDSE